ncbi:endothelin-converting enzyme 1 [Stomoxys calcitrans]|uniref:endothelin-converting enzyme 1 n=1 Tax=Stomoxys calcitrans TaxID=35570 RepID=UPI0027E2D8EA|nr:endothelin-converting enzyme 1 [Stomoxys calcitrans]
MSLQRKWPSFTNLLLVICLVSGEPNAIDVEQLEDLQLSLDENFQACENFYGHACGNWPLYHASDIESDLEEYLRYKHVLKFKSVLNQSFPREKQTKKPRQNFIGKAVAFFYSCQEEVNKLDFLKYLDVLKPGPGLEWPLLEVIRSQQRHEPYVPPQIWPLGKFDLFALLGELMSYGLNQELVQMSWVTINDRPSLHLQIPEMADVDRNLWQSVFKNMSLPTEVRRKYLGELLKVHERIQMLYENYSQKTEMTEFQISFAELQKESPHLYTLVDKIVPQHLRTAHDVVLITDYDYFPLLLEHFQNPYKIQRLCNYLMVKFLIFMKYQDHSNCFYTIKNKLHLAYDYLLYKHDYLPQAEDLNWHINSLNKKIYKQFESLLKENRLDLSAQQLEFVQERLSNITLNIGNLPDHINETWLEDYFYYLSDMDIDNFYGNNLQVLRHHQLEALCCPRKVLCSPELPALPHYEPFSHAIIIPFASLSLPLYHLDMDPLFTLSTFGQTLAHTYVQALDVQNLYASTPLFKDIQAHPSVRCLQLREPSKEINQRIADLVAARVAFLAYQQEYKYNLQPTFSPLPWQKMFFLNLAHFYCVKEPDTVDELHDSPVTRLNQIALNLEVFGEVFHCPMGSKMNPARKCRYL